MKQDIKLFLGVIHKMLFGNLAPVYDDLSQLQSVDDEQDGSKHRAFRDSTL